MNQKYLEIITCEITVLLLMRHLYQRDCDKKHQIIILNLITTSERFTFYQVMANLTGTHIDWKNVELFLLPRPFIKCRDKIRQAMNSM